MRFKAGGFLGKILQVLGLNGVPVAGFLGEGWSSGTALALYWLEGVLVILFLSLRIVLHRRWTKKAGHWRSPSFTRASSEPGRSVPSEPRRGGGSLLAGYLGVAVPFTLVHGLFLGLLLLLFLPREFGASAGVSFVDLRMGLAGVFAFLLLGFAIDLVSLRRKPFRWLELMTHRALGRIFVVHLTILGGVFAMMYWHAPAGLFLVFAGLKTLIDFGGAFPHQELTLDPPRWAKHLDRVKTADGESFSEHWRRTEAHEQRLREENERVVEGA